MMTAEEPSRGDCVLEATEMEGQEAILVEEDVPATEIVSTKKKLPYAVHGSEKKKEKKPKRRSLFRKSVDYNESKEDATLTTVPPKDEGRTSPKTRVVLLDTMDSREVKKKQAAHKVEYSRKLLEVALRPHDQATADISEEDREKMARAAFQQAAEARRLVEGEVIEDLATVMSENASKGEAAAARAQCILLQKKVPPTTDDCKAEAKSARQGEKNDHRPPPQENFGGGGSRFTPPDLFEEAEAHATKARHHLEAILPVFECLAPDYESVQPQPVLPTQGIFTDAQEEETLSTLGFDNTFQDTLLSITSLNEILDAPLSPAESQVEAPTTALQEEYAENVKSKGRLSMFRRRSQKEPQRDEKEHSESHATQPSTEEANNDRHVERFIATIVQDDDDDSVSSDISNRSELARIKALETMTESKLKEAMEADDGGSLRSWCGVPLFAAEEGSVKKQTSTKKGMEGEPHVLKNLDIEQGSSHSFLDGKPEFVPAPDFDPKILSSRSWNDVVTEKEEKERQRKEEELAKAEKKKWGLPKWGRSKAEKQSVIEGRVTLTPTKAVDSKNTVEKALAEEREGETPETSREDNEDLNEVGAPSIKSQDEGGDRYAVLAKDTVEDAIGKKQSPIAKDIDMMPDQPEPRAVRNATSLDLEQQSVDEIDDIKFADVEIGTEQVEKRIMSRDTVIEKITKAPRNPKSASEASDVERVRTLPSGDGVSDIEPSRSMIDHIEKQKKDKNDEKKKGGRRQSKLLKHMFGRSKRNKSVETKENSPDSIPPGMCLVNTGSSSDCQQKAGEDSVNEVTHGTSML